MPPRPTARWSAARPRDRRSSRYDGRRFTSWLRGAALKKRGSLRYIGARSKPPAFPGKFSLVIVNPKALAAVGLFAASLTAVAAEPDTGPALGAILTPPGVTLQVLGKGQGYDLGKQSAAA